MFVVVTRVKLREGTGDQCAELFRRTNPELVNDEQDWLGAKMIFDKESSIVTVLASWKNTESYNALSATPKFQATMREFAQFFASPPDITLNELLVEMSPDSI